MPRESEFKKLIPTIYKRDALNHMMFAHVNAVRYNLSGSTIEMAVDQFMKYYGLTEDEWPAGTAIRTFHNMTKELHQLHKTKSDGN